MGRRRRDLDVIRSRLPEYAALPGFWYATHPRSDLAMERLASNIHRVVERDERLSDRQWQVLYLLAEGYKEESGSRVLGIARFTWRQHVKEARRRLGARTSTHAVAIAIRRGLI